MASWFGQFAVCLEQRQPVLLSLRAVRVRPIDYQWAVIKETSHSSRKTLQDRAMGQLHLTKWMCLLPRLFWDFIYLQAKSQGCQCPHLAGCLPMCLFHCGPQTSSPLAARAVNDSVAFHLPSARGKQITTGNSLFPHLLQLTVIVACAEL